MRRNAYGNIDVKKTQLRIFVKDRRGAVPLRAFLAALEAVLEAGGDVDRNYNGKSRVRWKIAELQNGSAGAVIEGVPESARFLAAAEEVVALVKDGLGKLESKCTEIPRYFSERSFAKLKSLANKTNRNLEVTIGEQTITRQTVATIENLTSPRACAVDTIDGYLDMARVRGGKRLLLYDDRDRKIDCFFPDELIEMVRKGWGEKVRVRGDVQKTPAGYPLSITVRTIEILGQAEAFDLKSFIGIWDMDIPGEEYVRRIRDE